jgi:hypothetical protein
MGEATSHRLYATVCVYLPTTLLVRIPRLARKLPEQRYLTSTWIGPLFVEMYPVAHLGVQGRLDANCDTHEASLCQRFNVAKRTSILEMLEPAGHKAWTSRTVQR